jgi:hypothetical protein
METLMANSGYKGITRLDRPRKKMHGWYVRVYLAGKSHAKYFSDVAYDGEQEALLAAIDWRDETEKDLGKPRTERRVLLVSPRNHSGRLGVRRVMKEGAPVYEVFWSPAPNKLQGTSISIRKYGEEEAFRRACALRREKEREMYGGELHLRRRPPGDA